MAAAPVAPLFSLFRNSSGKISTTFLTTTLWTLSFPVFGLEMEPQSQVRDRVFFGRQNSVSGIFVNWADFDYVIRQTSPDFGCRELAFESSLPQSDITTQALGLWLPEFPSRHGQHSEFWDFCGDGNLRNFTWHES